MNDNQHAADVAHGIAALTLLEALILILLDKRIITDDQVDDAFEAAIDAHCRRNLDIPDLLNKRTVQILERLRVEGNAVRLD